MAVSTTMLNEESFSAARTGAYARGASSQTMSVRGAAVKSFCLLVLAGAFMSIGWNHAGRVISAGSGPTWILGYFVLIALTIAAASRPRLAFVLGVLYAVLMGAWMGAISRIYEAAYDGVVAQTLAATIGTFVVCLVLYSTRSVRVSGRFVMVLSAAIGGLLMLYVFGAIWSLFSGGPAFFERATPTGIAVSVIACLLAALSLFTNFAYIEAGAAAGAPKGMEWYAAFGLLSTLVWLYLEFLELFAKLNAQRE